MLIFILILIDINGYNTQRFGYWDSIDESINLLRCTFLKISSPNCYGGVIFFGSGSQLSNLNIEISLFIECNSGKIGGAVYFDSRKGSTRIHRTCFKRCHAPDSLICRLTSKECSINQTLLGYSDDKVANAVLYCICEKFGGTMMNHTLHSCRLPGILFSFPKSCMLITFSNYKTITSKESIFFQQRETELVFQRCNFISISTDLSLFEEYPSNYLEFSMCVFLEVSGPLFYQAPNLCLINQTKYDLSISYTNLQIIDPKSSLELYDLNSIICSEKFTGSKEVKGVNYHRISDPDGFLMLYAHDCIFVQIRSNDSGGSISMHIAEFEIFIYGCTFDDIKCVSRSALLKGGAIWIDINIGNVNISKCCAKNCSSTNGQFIFTTIDESGNANIDFSSISYCSPYYRSASINSLFIFSQNKIGININCSHNNAFDNPICDSVSKDTVFKFSHIEHCIVTSEYLMKTNQTYASYINFINNTQYKDTFLTFDFKGTLIRCTFIKTKIISNNIFPFVLIECIIDTPLHITGITTQNCIYESNPTINDFHKNLNIECKSEHTPTAPSQENNEHVLVYISISILIVSIPGVFFYLRYRKIENDLQQQVIMTKTVLDDFG